MWLQSLPNTSDHKPKFCSKCGQELIAGEIKPFEYNGKIGWPSVYAQILRCPTFSWFKFWTVKHDWINYKWRNTVDKSKEEANAKP